MKYRIVIEKRAQKFIKKLPQNDITRILRAINKLPEGDIKTLRGYDDVYRLRVGDYRIIYEINDEVLMITVVDAGNRGQIYKRY